MAGGLTANVALASTPYRETIAAQPASLRDFLLLFFFIALGATLDLSLLGNACPWCHHLLPLTSLLPE